MALLVDKGFDLKLGEQNTGTAMLTEACDSGNLEMIRWLLEHGVPPASLRPPYRRTRRNRMRKMCRC